MSAIIDLSAPIRAFHFTERPDAFRGGRQIPQPGTWLVMGGEIAICCRGLHYSRRAIDALHYAPGNVAHLVEVAGVVTEQSDKGVCRARRIVASVDAETLLRDFARACASDVLHLWDAPQIVRDWLATGEASLCLAARSAAYSAAYSAADSAADSAACLAARSAAYSAQNARLESMLLTAMGVPS